MTSNFFLVLSFEDHFKFVMLYLNKYLKINRVKTFDLNTVEKRKVSQKSVKVTLQHCLWLLFHGYFYGHLAGFF